MQTHAADQVVEPTLEDLEPQELTDEELAAAESAGFGGVG